MKQCKQCLIPKVLQKRLEHFKLFYKKGNNKQYCQNDNFGIVTQDSKEKLNTRKEDNDRKTRKKENNIRTTAWQGRQKQTQKLVEISGKIRKLNIYGK